MKKEKKKSLIAEAASTAAAIISMKIYWDLYMYTNENIGHQTCCFFHFTYLNSFCVFLYTYFIPDRPSNQPANQYMHPNIHTNHTHHTHYDGKKKIFKENIVGLHQFYFMLLHILFVAL